MNNRRRIILFAAPALALGLAGTRASAQAKVAESDPAAMALGYKEDAAKVDATKYKQYVKGNICANCNFYAGKAGDATAPCAVLGNRLVAGKGWCSAYAKKA